MKSNKSAIKEIEKTNIIENTNDYLYDKGYMYIKNFENFNNCIIFIQKYLCKENWGELAKAGIHIRNRWYGI